MKTTVKKITMALALAALALCTQAQVSLRGGIAGGVITGPVRLENIGNSFTNVINGNDINGFELGFMAKAQLGPLYLKPMALYGMRYGKVTYNTADGQQTTNFNMNKVEIPVLVGIRFLGPLYIEAGPSYNYIFNLTDKYNSNSLQVNQTAMGYRIGLGAELGPLLLSVNYGGVTYKGDNSKTTFREPYKLIFGLGILFGGDIDRDRNKSVKDHE
jgi:hypothetical protein